MHFHSNIPIKFVFKIKKDIKCRIELSPMFTLQELRETHMANEKKYIYKSLIYFYTLQFFLNKFTRPIR